MKSANKKKTGASPQDAPAGFEGFAPEAFKLFRQLKKNNNREWFRERKTAYLDLVEQPMERLLMAVGEQCRAQGLSLFPKEKNPVFRIYRDIRFSSDKTPYKTHAAGEMRRSFTTSQTMLYVHFDPNKSFVAAGVWQPERSLLQAWRQAIISRPEEVHKMATALKKKKLDFSFEHSLSSMPRGFQNFTAALEAPYLKLTSFVVSREIDEQAWLSTKLVGAIVKFALDAKPLFEFGWKVEASLPKSFPG